MAEVITRLNEAASAIRRLPEGCQYERPFLTSWPDYKLDPNTAYGYEDVKGGKAISDFTLGRRTLSNSIAVPLLH